MKNLDEILGNLPYILKPSGFLNNIPIKKWEIDISKVKSQIEKALMEKLPQKMDKTPSHENNNKENCIIFGFNTYRKEVQQTIKNFANEK